jgi:hypothetical protein
MLAIANHYGILQPGGSGILIVQTLQQIGYRRAIRESNG